MESKIKLILTNFIKDPRVVDLFVSPKTLKYWRRSFTHESVNYDTLENYEKLEFLGDAMMNYSFVLFLQEDLKITKSSECNNLKSYYMSKKYQPIMAKKLGLLDFIIINPKIKVTSDIEEDIMESFFGMINLLCNYFKKDNPDIIKSPLHYGKQFFIWYFSTFDRVDPNKGHQASKTTFDQIYAFFSGVSPQKVKNIRYFPETKSFSFGQNFITVLGYYDKELAIKVRKILTSKGHDENYYYREVISIMSSYGLDSDWLTQEKAFVKIANESDNLKEIFNGKMVDRFTAIANKNGFTRFVLQRNDKDSYDLLAQGVDPKTKDSISVLLHSFEFTNDLLELKRQAFEIILKKYL